MGHVGYQNLLRLPKIADGIKVKDLISVKIIEDCMNERKPRKLFYKPISNINKYLDNLNCDFSELNLITQKVIDFILAF